MILSYPIFLGVQCICFVENKRLINGSLNVIILKLLSREECMYGYESVSK